MGAHRARRRTPGLHWLIMAATRAPPLLLLALLCACSAALGSANAAAAGRKMYELKAGDFSVSVTNWGATITSVVLPDLLSHYLANKQSLHVRSQDLEIFTLIGKK